uniref:Uncharacterized protein n=1 Tax=Timema cristinae TaxID=61476 RepID=A0A7R9D929_TIMCR|nr:unnamed protein product [Timema cristinae]
MLKNDSPADVVEGGLEAANHGDQSQSCRKESFTNTIKSDREGDTGNKVLPPQGLAQRFPNCLNRGTRFRRRIETFPENSEKLSKQTIVSESAASSQRRRELAPFSLSVWFHRLQSNPNKSDRLIIHNKEEYSSKLLFELLKPNVRLWRIPKVAGDEAVYLMIVIAAFAIVYGNPLRLINGYDSFGNTCGTSNNEKMGGLALSGMDTSDKQCSHEILNSSDLMQGLESGHYSGCTELDYSLHTIQPPTHCRFSVIPPIHEVQINTHINKCLQNSSSKSSSRGINYWDELYLFFMDVRHVSQSMKICVKKCPDHNLETLEDIQTFYKREHSLLCRFVNNIHN